MKIPVQGYTGLVRDTNSGAVINIASGGKEYSVHRARIAQEQERYVKTTNREIIWP
jgi:hypothetical protein